MPPLVIRRALRISLARFEESISSSRCPIPLATASRSSSHSATNTRASSRMSTPRSSTRLRIEVTAAANAQLGPLQEATSPASTRAVKRPCRCVVSGGNDLVRVCGQRYNSFVGAWSAVSGQLSAVNGQRYNSFVGAWSVVSGQWSVVSGQSSVVSRQSSVVSRQRSVVSGQWSVASGQWPIVSARTILLTWLAKLPGSSGWPMLQRMIIDLLRRHRWWILA